MVLSLINIITMKKYKVLVQLYKRSEKKNYEIGDTIELTQDEAAGPLADGMIEALEFEAPKDFRSNKRMQ